MNRKLDKEEFPEVVATELKEQSMEGETAGQIQVSDRSPMWLNHRRQVGK